MSNGGKPVGEDDRQHYQLPKTEDKKSWKGRHVTHQSNTEGHVSISKENLFQGGEFKHQVTLAWNEGFLTFIQFIFYSMFGLFPPQLPAKNIEEYKSELQHLQQSYDSIRKPISVFNFYKEIIELEKQNPENKSVITEDLKKPTKEIFSNFLVSEADKARASSQGKLNLTNIETLVRLAALDYIFKKFQEIDGQKDARTFLDDELNSIRSDANTRSKITEDVARVLTSLRFEVDEIKKTQISTALFQLSF